MEDRRVAEYFVVAGLPDNPKPLADFSCDGATLKPTHNLPPITDLSVINRALGEVVPDGYTCIETTPSGLVANINQGALRAPEMFLCYRRGRDKQPLVDIGVLYEGRERVMPDSQIVEFTYGGRSANINSSGQTTYMTYRRASENAACNELVVSDVCVIMTNRGEQAPHSYCTIDRNLNKGTMVGSDIYVCYKKSMNRSTSIAYMAGVLDQYPYTHRPGFPLPPDLALFCLPMGATLESWPENSTRPQPVSSTFVLTVTPGDKTESVEKIYGAAVAFYEAFPRERLTPEQRAALRLDEHFNRRNSVHTNRSICLLSRWPFFDTFDRFLRYLHGLANSGPHLVPIERYIHHFLECIPFPSARRPRILIQLDARERISLTQPEDSPIPLSGAKFRQLVMNLRPEGCLTVLLYALTEQKILLHSLRPDVLTAVSEAISMIIFPFHWQCPYIPLCPLGLSDLLNAPIPFLLGLDSRFFDLYDPPSDVICIDLDTGAIYVPEDKRHLVTKLLPPRPARTLRASLEGVCEKMHRLERALQQHSRTLKQESDSSIDSEFKMKRKEQQLDIEIQEAFLRFTASILKGYSAFLLPIVSSRAGATCDTASLFDIDAFVKSRDRRHHRFYQLLVNTQMFSRFIEERSFVSDKDASLAFFDDCAEKVQDDDTTVRLLEVEAAQSEHTLFLPPPEPSTPAPTTSVANTPTAAPPTYTYKGFPKLRRDLFPREDPIPALPPQVKAPQTTPASPLARRTKQEVKTDQRLASRHAETPILWAKCLLHTCYSLWFTQLPAFASTQHHKPRLLQLAFKILTNMQKLHLSQADEVSYRVMMQLCGVYSQPILAVKVLCEMRQHGITPNAITYGYYNRAVMENKWMQSNLLWNKLRNVIIGVAAFKQCGLERARKRAMMEEVDSSSSRRMSVESSSSLPPHTHSTTTTTATATAAGATTAADHNYSSISEPSERGTSPPPGGDGAAPHMEVHSSAGILMSSHLDKSTLSAPPRPRLPRPTDLSMALSPTLDQYDKMTEATSTTSTTSSTSTRTPPHDITTATTTTTTTTAAFTTTTTTTTTTVTLSPTTTTTTTTTAATTTTTSAAAQDRAVPEYLSPGNFNYRKNELLSGGLSSMKSAVTIFSKKYNEIRDAITATNTPTRGAAGSHGGRSGMWDGGGGGVGGGVGGSGGGDGDDDSLVDGGGPWSRRESGDVTGHPFDDPTAMLFTGFGGGEAFGYGGFGITGGGGFSTHHYPSSGSHPSEASAPPHQDLFPPLGWDAGGPFCLGVWLTSCTRCHNCAALLYDEEIMAGWRPDDSNLNTKCAFCDKVTVPLLTITIYNCLHLPRPDQDHTTTTTTTTSTSTSTTATTTTTTVDAGTTTTTTTTTTATTATSATSTDTTTTTASTTTTTAPTTTTTTATTTSSAEGIVTPHSDPVTPGDDPLTQAASESASSGDPPVADLKDKVTVDLQRRGVRGEPITVPYLSPLVLRKELETVLSHEGDACLTQPTFTDHHPILYWNLLWYFSRLRVPSHLPGLCLASACVSRGAAPHPSWQTADWQNVYIRCLWDNAKYHEELGQPMYVQWQQTHTPSALVNALVQERTRIPRDVMQQVVTAIHLDDLTSALRLLLGEVKKRPAAQRKTHFPAYRDLLFLAAACIPPTQLNLTSFDREYRRAYEHCERTHGKFLGRCDVPPPIAVVFCRRYFSQLSLV